MAKKGDDLVMRREDPQYGHEHEGGDKSATHAITPAYVFAAEPLLEGEQYVRRALPYAAL